MRKRNRPHRENSTRTAPPRRARVRPRARHRGLTLIEMLAVVVILGLVAGTLVVGLSGSFGQARQELARTGIGIVCGRVELFHLRENRWPTFDEGLAVLSDGYATPADPHYLGPDRLHDPWGRAYLYLAPGPDGHPYEVLSYGADGRPGGEGENADVSSVRLHGGAR